MRLVFFVFVSVALSQLNAVESEAHTFTGFFDSTRLVSVSGTIVKVDWVNPNIWIHISVEDKTTGAAGIWAFEGPPPKVLTGQYYITREMFREGERITIVGWKGIPTANWSEAIQDSQLAKRIIAEQPARAAQFEFADGKKISVVQRVPNIR